MLVFETIIFFAVSEKEHCNSTECSSSNKSIMDTTLQEDMEYKQKFCSTSKELADKCLGKTTETTGKYLLDVIFFFLLGMLQISVV